MFSLKGKLNKGISGILTTTFWEKDMDNSTKTLAPGIGYFPVSQWLTGPESTQNNTGHGHCPWSSI